jgi:hypothetical protein
MRHEYFANEKINRIKYISAIIETDEMKEEEEEEIDKGYEAEKVKLVCVLFQ